MPNAIVQITNIKIEQPTEEIRSVASHVPLEHVPIGFPRVFVEYDLSVEVLVPFGDVGEKKWQTEKRNLGFAYKRESFTEDVEQKAIETVLAHEKEKNPEWMITVFGNSVKTKEHDEDFMKELQRL